jgi:hypothetical protein
VELFLWGAWESIKSFVFIVWTEFKWPHAALVVCYIVISNFRGELRAAIGRLNKLGPTGAEFGPAPTPEELQGDRELSGETVGAATSLPPVGYESRTTKVVIPLPPYAIPQSLADAQSNIRSEVDGMQSLEVFDYLVTRLAMMRVLYDFENTYSLIFGGQIKFLNYMNQRLATGCVVAEVEAFWAAHKIQFAPHMDAWTMDNYLEFLRYRGLIRTDGSVFFLTVKGHEFLVWLLQSGKSQEKPW